MPAAELIGRYALKFGCRLFDSLTWLFPILSKFLSDESNRVISNSFDNKLSVKFSAFAYYEGY